MWCTGLRIAVPGVVDLKQLPELVQSPFCLLDRNCLSEGQRHCSERLKEAFDWPGFQYNWQIKFYALVIHSFPLLKPLVNVIDLVRIDQAILYISQLCFSCLISEL